MQQPSKGQPQWEEDKEGSAVPEQRPGHMAISLGEGTVLYLPVAMLQQIADAAAPTAAGMAGRASASGQAQQSGAAVGLGDVRLPQRHAAADADKQQPQLQPDVPSMSAAQAAEAPSAAEAPQGHASSTAPRSGSSRQQGQTPGALTVENRPWLDDLHACPSWRAVRDLLLAAGQQAAAPEPADAAPVAAVPAAGMNEGVPAAGPPSVPEVTPLPQQRQLLLQPHVLAAKAAAAAAQLRRVALTSEAMSARERLAFKSFMSGYLLLCGYLLPLLGPLELTSVLYNVAALGSTPPPAWMAAWLRAAGPQLRTFSPQQLANAAAALGRLQYDPGPAWLSRLCSAADAFLELDLDLAADPAAQADAPSVHPGEDVRVPAKAGGDPLARTEPQHQEVSEGAGSLAAPVTSTPAQGQEQQPAGAGGRSRSSCRGFTPEGIYQLGWGLARLQHRPGAAFLERYSRRALQGARHFVPHMLSNVVWALATLRYSPRPVWRRRMAAACLTHMPHFSPFDLSVVIWGLVRMGHMPDPDWLAAFLAASYGCLPAAEAEHAARMLWGVARCGGAAVAPLLEGDWIGRWFECTYLHMSEAQPQTLMMVMWALSELRLRPPSMWADALMIAAWEAPLAAFPPQELVVMLWGMARTRMVPDAAWMDELWHVSFRRLHVLPPRHQALLLWSAVKLGQAPTARWLLEFERATLPSLRAGQYGAVGVSLIMSAYGALEVAPGADWMAALYEATSREGFQGYNALALERLLWGTARVSAAALAAADGPMAPASPPPEEWTRALLAAFERELWCASYGNIANTLLAVAELGVQPGTLWLEAVMEQSLELMADFGSTTLAKVAWALPRLEGGDAVQRRHWARAVEARLTAVSVPRASPRAAGREGGHGGGVLKVRRPARRSL